MLVKVLLQSRHLWSGSAVWDFLQANMRRRLNRQFTSQSAAICPDRSPVHDESHLGGKAIATVHTQVPGHT